MWKMRMLKSIEFYKNGIEKPWRVTLLVRTDGLQVIELSAPTVDIDKVRLGALLNGDYNLVLDIMMRAINPDEIHQSVERGWE